MKNPEISVIVPVYNAEKYLKKCINSILGQTFQDYELILIDDGSTDKSSKICDEFSRNDERIKVIHKENEGLVYARNEGINISRGQYIAFVDADDWIEIGYLSTMIKKINKSGADIIATGCLKETENEIEKKKNNIPSGIYEGDDLKFLYKKMLYFEGFYEFGILQYMWNKLFRRKILVENGMNIDPEIYDGEDVARLYPCILAAKKIQLTDDCLYHYIIHKDSMTGTRKIDFYKNISKLYLYLNQEFQKSLLYNELLVQLNQYFKRMAWLGMPTGITGENRYLFPFGRIPKGANIILYAAGMVGRSYYRQINETKYCNIVAWIDKNCQIENKEMLNIKFPEELNKCDFDYVVIAVKQKKIVNEIINLLKDLNVKQEKIIW